MRRLSWLRRPFPCKDQAPRRQSHLPLSPEPCLPLYRGWPGITNLRLCTPSQKNITQSHPFPGLHDICGSLPFAPHHPLLAFVELLICVKVGLHFSVQAGGILPNMKCDCTGLISPAKSMSSNPGYIATAPVSDPSAAGSRWSGQGISGSRLGKTT